MQIIDLNRAGGIGSNSLFARLGPFSFVVDAGLHPKLAGIEATPDFSRLEDVELDFVIVTHCHLDHIGSLPVLLRNRPDTRVIMSKPSQMLVERMLHNSCNVMLRQKAEQSIKEYPLFTHDDVDIVGRQFEPLEFDAPLPFYSGSEELTVTLRKAGHVAGAGGFEVAYDDRDIFFTGDVLFDPQRTLAGASFPAKQRFDTIFIETTRGETERPVEKTREAEIDRLMETIRNTLQRGGSILIPVFALGRMQEVLTLINEARKSGQIPSAPVFGAGLGLDLANYYDQIAKRTQLVKFSRRTIKELRLKRPPRKLTPGREPPQQGIYVLSSGMMVEHTPSYNMAACLLRQPRNAICFVGYCDPDTPGGKLLDTPQGKDFVFEALDYVSPVRAQIERFEMSGHADRDEILEFALQAEPRAIVLTHGDEGARDWFAESLRETNPEISIVNPKPLQPYEV